MGQLIVDQFSSLKISRQRRYQLRREEKGLCRSCGDQAVPGQGYCAKHLEAQRCRCRAAARGSVNTPASSPSSNPQDLI